MSAGFSNDSHFEAMLPTTTPHKGLLASVPEFTNIYAAALTNSLQHDNYTKQLTKTLLTALPKRIFCDPFSITC